MQKPHDKPNLSLLKALQRVISGLANPTKHFVVNANYCLFSAILYPIIKTLQVQKLANMLKQLHYTFSNKFDAFKFE